MVADPDTVFITVSDVVGASAARAARAIARRAAGILVLQTLLLCALHGFLPAHGPDLVAAGHGGQTAGHHATAHATADAGHGPVQHAGSAGWQPVTSHHDGPVCHQDGPQDGAGLTARADRPGTPDAPCGPAVPDVVAAPDMSPPAPRTAETAPARAEGGRHHLLLAQISRT